MIVIEHLNLIYTLFVILALTLMSILSIMISYFSAKNGSNLAIEAGNIVNSLDEMSFSDWFVNVTGGDFLLLFMLIIAVLEISNEYSSGYIKNLYGCMSHKWNYVMSKYIMDIVFALLFLVVCGIVLAITNVFILKCNEFGNVNALLKYAMLRWLLLSVYGILISSITIIARRGLYSFIIGVGYSFMLANPLYEGINLLAKNVFKVNDFNVSKYSIIGNCINLNLDITNTQLTNILLVSLIVCVIISFITNIVFIKRDCM